MIIPKCPHTVHSGIPYQDIPRHHKKKVTTEDFKFIGPIEHDGRCPVYREERRQVYSPRSSSPLDNLFDDLE